MICLLHNINIMINVTAKTNIENLSELYHTDYYAPGL